MTDAAGPTRIPCVGAVILDDAGQLLMILRGHDPARGLWSIPGGRIESGETPEQAVVREVREETSLEVSCGPLLGTAELPGLDGAIVEIRDYRAFLTSGSADAVAGDDAADVRWVGDAEATAMDERGEVTRDLLRTLRAWNVGILLDPIDRSDQCGAGEHGRTRGHGGASRPGHVEVGHERDG